MALSPAFQDRHKELFLSFMKELENADTQGIAMSCNTDVLDLEVWPRYRSISWDLFLF